MPPYHYKPWLRRLLEQAVVVFMVLLLLPSIVVLVNALLRPVLVVIAIAIVLIIAVRGLAGFVEQRRGRW